MTSCRAFRARQCSSQMFSRLGLTPEIAICLYSFGDIAAFREIFQRWYSQKVTSCFISLGTDFSVPCFTLQRPCVMTGSYLMAFTRICHTGVNCEGHELLQEPQPLGDCPRQSSIFKMDTRTTRTSTAPEDRCLFH